MNVTKHSSKTSLLKELKKQIQLGATQVAITLVDENENETYELVVFGAGTSVGSKEKEQKVEGE